MIAKFLIFVTFVTAGSAWSHAFFLDKCPDFTPVDDFDLDRYLGGWYEIERYPMIYETFTSCVWTNYTVTAKTSQGTYLDIYMTYKRFGMKGEGTLPALKRNDSLGDFIVMPSEDSKPNSFILKTDYDTYSLNYNCEDDGLFGMNDFAWIYARNKTLPQETIDELKDYLKSLGSDISKFHHQDQLDCDDEYKYDRKVKY